MGFSEMVGVGVGGGRVGGGSKSQTVLPGPREQPRPKNNGSKNSSRSV